MGSSTSVLSVLGPAVGYALHDSARYMTATVNNEVCEERRLDHAVAFASAVYIAETGAAQPSGLKLDSNSRFKSLSLGRNVGWSETKPKANW